MKINPAVRNFFKNLTRHPWTKLFAVIFAVMLWSYVISVTDVKRSITLTNMSVSLTGDTQLGNADLALLENPVAALKNVSVELSVANKDISKINQSNVTIYADVSGITEPGEHVVKLGARSQYAATIENISPASVTVIVENMSSRAVPTEAEAIGRLASGYWNSIPRVTPDSVQIYGPKSLVEQVEVAHASVDITDSTGTVRVPLSFTLRDGKGNVISSDQLTVNTSAVTVSLQILPKKKYQLTDAHLVTGEPMEGYRIKEISVTPETLELASREEELANLPDDVRELPLLDPVDISGLSESKSFSRKLQIPDNMEYYSASTVYIEVEIEEDTETVPLLLPIEHYGLGESYSAAFEPVSATLLVTGQKDVVENINPSRFQIFAELTGLEPGTHTVALKPRADEYAGVSVALEVETAEVTIAALPAEADSAQ